ncbi:hypothetical protein AB0H00_20640 [Nocardia sp. NPDC023852]|uniref:hypothetical protein n=1 Tax=Nocardia sp. NPDC023852 TaxID=3154697 RepID=UPI0033E71231
MTNIRAILTGLALGAAATFGISASASAAAVYEFEHRQAQVDNGNMWLWVWSGDGTDGATVFYTHEGDDEAARNRQRISVTPGQSQVITTAEPIVSIRICSGDSARCGSSIRV